MDGIVDDDDDALCGVAKVSPFLLQRLGCKCWDVLHISLRHDQHHPAPAAAAGTLSKQEEDDDDDDLNNLLLTSFIVQVIPDDNDEIVCASSSHFYHQQVVCIHSVLLDFVHAAAAATAESSLSSVTTTSHQAGGAMCRATSDTTTTTSALHGEEHDDPSIVVLAQLSSFGGGGGHYSFHHQHHDDNDYEDNDGEHHEQQQQYQWRVQKVTTSSSSSSSAIRQLDNGSTLVVQCVYSDAPIIHILDAKKHQHDDDDDDSLLVNNNGAFFSRDDLAAALQDRLVQKGCIILLPIVSAPAPRHLKQLLQQQLEGQQQGYVIARIQDIIHLPRTSTTGNSDDVDGICDTSHRPEDGVYRLGTGDCFQLSILPASSSSSSSSCGIWSAEGAAADERNNDDDCKDCPGYESVQQQLVQLLDPSYSNNNSSGAQTSLSFCPPTGVLLTGSVGVGKTRLAKCVARQLHHKNKIHYTSLQDVLMQAVATTGGGGTLEELKATLLPPFTNVLMIDDLHILATTTEDAGTEQESSSFSDMHRQLLQSALLQVIDRCVEQGISCLGMASTEWKLLPTMLIKFGRLEKQLEMSSPTQHQREMILQKQLVDVMMPTAVDNIIENNKAKHWASILAPLTAGCVAADLCRLCHNAQILSWALQQQVDDHDDDVVSSIRGEGMSRFSLPPPPPLLWEDLRDAAQELVPLQLATLDVIKPEPPPLPLALYDKSGPIMIGNSSSSSTPPTRNDDDGWRAIHEQSWSRLAGYSAVKKRVYRTIVAPWRRFLKHEHEHQKHSSNNFDDNGDNVNGDDNDQRNQSKQLLIPPPTGVIFHGASGSGKTLAATCLGASLEWSMIHVNVATDILDQWLGGSEASLRSLFARARAAAPCILFLDEMDAIACNRNNNDNGDSTNVMSRLLSTLLNEMDGIGGSSLSPSKVLVVACTNQPLDSLDAALLRPGRLDHHVELKTPVTLNDAVTILQLYLTRKSITSKDDQRIQENDQRSLLHYDVNLQVIADRALRQGSKLHEVTGANLEGLARQAILSALRRSMADVSKGRDTDEVIQVTMQDFDEALSRV